MLGPQLVVETVGGLIWVEEVGHCGETVRDLLSLVASWLFLTPGQPKSEYLSSATHSLCLEVPLGQTTMEWINPKKQSHKLFLSHILSQ